jgi:hypothetical protein
VHCSLSTCTKACAICALYFRRVIEFADQAFGKLCEVEIDIGLHRDIDLGCGNSSMTGQPGEAIQRAAKRERKQKLLRPISRKSRSPEKFRKLLSSGECRRGAGAP